MRPQGKLGAYMASQKNKLTNCVQHRVLPWTRVSSFAERHQVLCFQFTC